MNNYRFLSDSSFKAFVSGLVKDIKVFGTVKKDGFPAYSRITNFKELSLGQTPTHLSAKGFLFPEREVLLNFNIKDNTHEEVLSSEEIALIGLHPCDIKAIGLLDRVFSCGSRDANYLSRRQKTIIIGTECMPDAYCFCSSINTMTVDEGFDMMLHRIKKGYLVNIASGKAEAILKKYCRLRKATQPEVRELAGFYRLKEASFKARLNAPYEKLPEIYAASDSSPVWEKIGSICYGCGSCNNVCPTCYCFDVRDEVGPDLSKGQRLRVWDGCTLEDFAKVAGGHNFRLTRAERLKHRFNRKFRYQSNTFKSLFCVGCGRCSRTCLVKINIAEVTNELIREYYAKGKR